MQQENFPTCIAFQFGCQQLSISHMTYQRPNTQHSFNFAYYFKNNVHSYRLFHVTHCACGCSQLGLVQCVPNYDPEFP